MTVNKAVIEIIEAMAPNEQVEWYRLVDDGTAQPELTQSDLKQLARQAQAGAKLAKAAKEYLRLEGVDVFSPECNDAESELREALSECEKILGGTEDEPDT